ncbi:MAG TPA: thioesterase family protein [Syntrophales bacterium]|nr:thioesterase family protein [Syntrophales bacterium]
MEKDLAAYPVVVDVPVVWGEMDAFGHVNNIVYFRYFETARIAYFETLNTPEFLGRDPVGPILAETTCRFRAALAYPDTVSIGAKVARLGEDRFVMHYIVFSHRLRRIAAEGEGVMVCFDYRQNHKAPIPDKLRRRIEEIERAVAEH